MTSILIVEDHPIFSMGLARLIDQEPDLSVCGQAEDVAGARQAIAEKRPDVVILDLSLKDSNGMELLDELAGRAQRPLTLVLSMHDETLHAQRCLAAGARGYIMKHEALESVIVAIRRIIEGRIYVSEKVTGQILDKFSSSPESFNRPPLELLANRELEVFQLIGRGLSTGAIARQLKLSARTVGTYRERIKEKLGLKDASALVRYAVLWEERLVNPSSDVVGDSPT